MEEGKYTFRPPDAYKVEVSGPQVSILDVQRNLIISMIGGVTPQEFLPDDDVADMFLSKVFKPGVGAFTKEDSYPIQVDNVEGTGYDLSGTLSGNSFRGQAVIVQPSSTQFFFALGIINTEGNSKRWIREGEPVFRALINSVTFPTVSGNGSNTCVISSDDTYGYTMENPIRVGGDAFGGPSREKAYLNNLRGPNGEEIHYERKGSIPYNDTILDEYVITGLSKLVTLYLDEYSWSEPQAPVGFTCATDFWLSPP
jgi:hypothetical protein